MKARIALQGPSGGGKTYTALTFAHAVSERVAVVDTERGSASTYQGMNGWDFDVFDPSGYDPKDLAEALREAGAEGYGAVIVDSLSHYWSGKDGMLELSDRLQTGHNKFSGWTKAGERERDMLDALLGYPGHVVVTLRTKNDTVVEEDDKGRKRTRVVGLKPVQRDGIEYEFGLVGELDQSNTLRVIKSRFAPVAVGDEIARPGPDLARTIAEWLENGEALPSPAELAAEAMAAEDRDALLALLDRVHRAGYDGAGVQDSDGNAVGLRDLIISRGTALKG